MMMYCTCIKITSNLKHSLFVITMTSHMKGIALWVAALNGHTAVVEMLVKAGADVNKVSYVHVHEEVLYVHVEEHVLHPHCVMNPVLPYMFSITC